MARNNNNPYFQNPKAAAFTAPGQQQLAREEEEIKSTTGNGGATFPAKDVPGSAYIPPASTWDGYGPPAPPKSNFNFRQAQSNDAAAQWRNRNRAAWNPTPYEKVKIRSQVQFELPKGADFSTVIKVADKYKNNPAALTAIHEILGEQLEADQKTYLQYGKDNVYFFEHEQDILDGNVPSVYEKVYDFDAFRKAHGDHQKSLVKYDYITKLLSESSFYSASPIADDELDADYARQKASYQERSGKILGESTKPRTDVEYEAFLDRKPGAYKSSVYNRSRGMGELGTELREATDYYEKHKDNTYSDDFWGRVAANFRAGDIGVKSADAGYAAFQFKSDNLDANDIYDLLSNRLYNNNVATYVNNNGWDSWVANVSSYAPQYARQMLAQIQGGIVGALAGAALGQNAVSAVRGWSAGASLESARYMFRQTAGAAYVERLRETGDAETAYTLANNEALASAVVEFGLEFGTRLLGKGVSKLKIPENAEKALHGIMTKIGLSEGAQKTIISTAKFVGKQTVEYLSEGLEEGTQEGISIQAERAAKEGLGTSPLGLLSSAFDYNTYSDEEKERIRKAVEAGGSLALFGGGVQSGIGAVGAIKNWSANKQAAKVEAQTYMLTPAQKEFDDLSPAAQKIVQQEFADRPQELQSFIQRKSPTGSISKNAQKIIDAATDAVSGKKKSMLNGVNTKVSATMPSDTVITADTNGVVAVDAAFTPGVAKVMDALSKRTGLKFGYAEYYQNGKKNAAYNGHYDPTTKTIYFRKGASKAEIIYQTAVHELTHFAESSKHYKYVSDYVLNKKFEGVDSDAYKKAVKEKIAAYAKNGVELTPEEARRELVAENVRKAIFETKEEVNNLVKTDYTFAQRILDIIDSFIYHFNNTFGRLEGDAKIRADLKQAQRKYRMALASAKGMRGSGQSISYDMKMDYKHQVDLALDKKLKSGLSVYMGKASKFLIKIGLDPDLPMLINQSHLRDINHPKSEENRHWHGLSPEIIKQIPNELKNPVMVYDSISPNNAENSICVVTSLKDGDKLPVIVSIRVEGTGKNRYLSVEAIEQNSEGANFVTSAYGKDDFIFNLKTVLANDALIYANKNKTLRLISDSELELLTRLNNLGFDKIIHPSRNIVKAENKNSFSFSSPKSDTDTFDTDIPMRHIDGSVRTYAEYKAEQDAAAQAAEVESAHQTEEQAFTPAPGTDKSPMDNKDVAEVVNADGNKRADDIELQHSQRLKGKNSMLFKNISRVLDYVCDKMPELREFWRNRIEKPYWRAKASFTSRSRKYLTELKTAAEELDIRMGSKESAAAQWYGEGYRTVWQKNPSYEKGNGQPKQVSVREAYTLADLKRDFPTSWENIVKFDEFSRTVYDRYLAELNTMLVKVYPNLELQLEQEITDLRHSIENLRERPERIQTEIAAVEEDIRSLEASLADLQQRRDSGADIAGALDAIERKRASKADELAALKNKGTKKAATLEKQVATASDKAERLRRRDADTLDKFIKTVEARLESKRAELEKLQLQVSDKALELYHQQIDEKEALIKKKRHEIETGEAFRGKRVIPRKDYYHHFQEMSEGFEGLANILFNSDEIDPRLVAVSDGTKPKSTWEGFMQQQGFGAYDADALGGLHKYIQAAEYKLAFDPIISDMRSVIKTLAEDTSETRNANGFILYLTRWTDSLARKTNFIDRPQQEITQRKLTKVLNWLNSRAKGNTILGSFRNFFAQFMNLPNGFLYVQNLHDWGAGIKSAIATINKKSDAKAAISQSAFLGERYIGDLVDSFKESKVREAFKTPKKAAIMMMNAGDKFAANIIWNAAYAQGQRLGLVGEDLIMHADDVTRRAVAGRGVGEMPPAMESKWLNLIAPFQVEVKNTWDALLQTYGGKDAKTVGQRIGGIVMFEALAYGLNLATEALGIGSMLPSLYGLLGEVVRTWMDDDEEEEEELTVGQKIGKTAALTANEVLSYMPYASSVIPFLFDIEDVEALLGAENEVTRYGTGNIGLSGLLSAGKKAFQGDVEGAAVDFVTGYVTPWGGGQAKKLYEGAKDFGGFNASGESASYTPDGRLRFPMERTPANVAKGMLFGKYATKEGKEYIDTGRAPYSEERTEAFNAIVATGADPNLVYDTINEAAKKSRAEEKRRLIMDTPGLTAEQKGMLDNAFFEPRENPVDYSSEDNFVITSQLTSEASQRKAFGLLSSGMSATDAVRRMEHVNNIKGDVDETGSAVEGDAKLKKIKYVYNLDIPDEQKGALYRYCIVGEDNKSMVLARATGLSDAALAKAYPYLSLVEGTKNSNGETISGSKNKNINYVLSQLDLTEAEKDGLRVMFMTNSKARDSYETKLLNNLLSGNRLTPEWKKQFTAWYYDNDKRVDADALFRVLDGEKDVPVVQKYVQPRDFNIPKLF